ncbi:MAG: S9 family peptidase [Sandaracinaceae bacterium]|nr:S9 family peptidase [Sandaracinaceae bacterium]
MNARDALLCASLAALGCGVPPEPAPAPPETSGAERVAPSSRSELQALNARAREGAVVETLHGVAIDDPYRALEEGSELTRGWIDWQTARTDAFLRERSDAGAAARIDALLSIGAIGAPVVAGTRVFYTKREGDREQPALYVRDGARLRETPLIDPVSYGERAALDGFVPSPSGRYVAFRISENGDERSVLRVIEVASGRVLDEVIEHTKWSNVTWLRSETGFYYSRYPREGEPDWDAEHQDVYHVRLFFHALGTDPGADPLVFSPARGTDFPSASVSADDRWLVVGNFRGWSQSDVYLFDRGRAARGRRVAPDEAHPLVEVAVGADHLYSATVHRGRLYVTHNEGAPRYRVDAVAPERAAERAAWAPVVPEGSGTIDGVAFAADRVVVHTMEPEGGIASHLRVYRLDGIEEAEIALPGRGEVFGLDADRETGRVAIGFSSFVHPPMLLEWTARARAVTELDRVASDFDFAALRLGRAEVRSRDGTMVNVYYVHRADAPLDGQRAVLLYGYGGFNVSLLPGFQRNALYWIERGGVFAVANTRGGGEYGEAWHRAGHLADKERVFEDFEAVIEWLGGESGVSRPERIGIQGGSNGGLLMGAMVTRVPTRFRVALAGVGLYDMVRYHRFPPAELWISEYGSADASPEELRYLHAYSPYHRVRDGMSLPAVLITTADHDTRVHWAHSTKFAARLQEASGEADPEIYFHMDRQVGHGAGTRRSDLVQRYVRMYTFLERFVGRPEGAE